MNLSEFSASQKDFIEKNKYEKNNHFFISFISYLIPTLLGTWLFYGLYDDNEKWHNITNGCVIFYSIFSIFCSCILTLSLTLTCICYKYIYVTSGEMDSIFKSKDTLSKVLPLYFFSPRKVAYVFILLFFLTGMVLNGFYILSICIISLFILNVVLMYIPFKQMVIDMVKDTINE